LFSAPKISSDFLRVSCGTTVYANINNSVPEVVNNILKTETWSKASHLSRLPMGVELLDIGKKSRKLFV